MNNCRKCNSELNKLNCFPSYIEYNIKLCINCSILYEKEKYHKDRSIIIENLGGKCECCGEANSELLTIDHINGGGNKEKQAGSKGKKYLKKLKNMQNIKEIYRCLCYNCNYCLGFWGKCQCKI